MILCKFGFHDWLESDEKVLTHELFSAVDKNEYYLEYSPIRKVCLKCGKKVDNRERNIKQERLYAEYINARRKRARELWKGVAK